MKRLLFIIMLISANASAALTDKVPMGAHLCNSYTDGNSADHREIYAFLSGYLHSKMEMPPTKLQETLFTKKVFSLCEIIHSQSILDAAKSVLMIEDLSE